jgi:hypothetical protein
MAVGKRPAPRPTFWSRPFIAGGWTSFSDCPGTASTAYGGKGYMIEDLENCGAILDEALREPGPAIVEAVVDSHEPPLPPKITLEQAKKFAESLARGTQHGGKIALTVLADRVRELV